MKRPIFLINFLFLMLLIPVFEHSDLHAQTATKLRGKVLEYPIGTPLPYATITTLLDGKIVDGTVTDNDGLFELITKKNFDALEFSFLGFQSQTLRRDEVDKLLAIEIELRPDELQLEELNVVGEKSTTVSKVDRKVINLGTDIQNSSGDILDAMTNLPEVTIDRTSESLSLRGGSDVKVLVNGKPSGLSAFDLLEQIPASTVDRIELITSPSAKNQANGISGIIDIILKRDIQSGLNLNLTASLSNPIPKGRRIGLSGNYMYKLLNFRASANYSDRIYNVTRTFDRTYANNQTEQIISPNAYPGDVFSINTGVDFFIDDRNEFSISTNYNRSAHQGDGLTSISSLLDGVLISQEENRFQSAHVHETLLGNINYVHSFSPSHKIDLEYNVSDNRNDLGSSTEENDIVSVRDFLEHDNLLHDVNLDYSRPLQENTTFESGLAYDHRTLSDRLERVVLESDQRGLFEYQEKVYSAYLMMNHKREKLTLQGGLRFEHLDSSSKGSEENFELSRSFTNLFPSIHLSYQINDAHQINGGYSRRISRPNFRHVNPFSANPLYSQREGNPNLRPEFGHNLELNYQLLSAMMQWSSSVFYRRKIDIIESNLAIERNVQILSYDNLAQGNAFGIENRLTLSPFTFWDLTIDANYYSQNISTSSYVEFDRPFSSNLNIRNSIKLAGGMKADLNYQRRGSYRNTNASGDPYGSTDIAIRKSYLAKRLNVTLQVSDLFNNIERRSASYAENYVQEMLYRRGVNYSRHFSISLAYKIADSSTRTRNRMNRNHGHGGTSE